MNDSLSMIGDTELTPTTRRWFSLVLLGIAVALCFITYTKPNLILPDDSLSIRPDIVSTLFGLVVILPLYARQLLQWRFTPFCLVTFAINAFLASAFIQLVRGGGDDPDGWIDSALGLTVIMSWLGVRAVARWCLVALLALALKSVIDGGVVMGIYGYIFVVCSFLGLTLQSAASPHQLAAEFLGDYRVVGPIERDELTGSRTHEAVSHALPETSISVPLATKSDNTEKRPMDISA